MSSSTSSSRQVYRKISLAMVLVAISVIAAYYGFLLANNASKSGVMGRVAQAQQELPKIIAEDKPLMMFFGSSMVDAGFSPRVFDRLAASDGKTIKSFNFGFGGLNPYFQDFLSRRIRDTFKQEDKKLKLVLIEFNPFQTTQTRWNRAKFIVDSYLTMLASNEELWDIFLTDPERGLYLFNIKYLRNDISAETVTSFYGRALFPPKRPERVDVPQDNRDRLTEIGDKLSEAFEREYPDYQASRWSYDWQGGGTIPSERSAETLELFQQYYPLLQHEARMQNDLQSRIFTADIEELRFEPLLIEHFINMVENFKQVSERVEIVMLPRNTQWVEYTPEGKKRLAETIDTIENATGLKIVNHQNTGVITPQMFSDTTHLARYLGDVPYTKLVYQEFKEAL